MNQDSHNLIAGNNRSDTGPVWYNPTTKRLQRCKPPYSARVHWQSIDLPADLPNPTMIAGDAVNGPIIADNSVIFILENSLRPQWRRLDPPKGFSIGGLTGHKDMVAVYEENGHRVAYRLRSNDYWDKVPPANFEPKGIVGDDVDHSGVAVFNEHQVQRIKFNESAWSPVQDPPDSFQIELLTGNNRAGLVIYGKRHGRNSLQYMKSYADNVWIEISYPGFRIAAMAGEPGAGIACVVGADVGRPGDVVAYCGTWDRGEFPVIWAPGQPVDHETE